MSNLPVLPDDIERAIAVAEDDPAGLRILEALADAALGYARTHEQRVAASRAKAKIGRAGGGALVRMAERGERRRRNEGTRVSSALELTDLGLSKQRSSRWQALHRMTPTQFAKLLERLGADEVKGQSMRRMPGPPPGLTGTYGVIYADPPWPMPGWVESRDLERHYPTLSIDDIAAMEVESIAAEDAVLYLWAISTHLHEALHVVEAWGFEYVAQMVWVKDDIGTGWWVRHQHELLLIGRRGEVSPPAPEQRISSVIRAASGRHSEKPDVVPEYLVDVWPDVPRVELFGRKPRDGWTVIGDEAAA